ncbi:MAG: glucose-1-phosphate thymidylyltransferase [Armatimonadota bacterium]
MKGLILSGGKGTRLRPLTFTRAKQLIPIANKPNLFYGIDDIVGAGILDIGVIISPDTGDEVIAAIGDGSQWGARFTFILQEKPKGLAHAVMTAREFLGDDPFVMYLGDNLLSGGIAHLVDEFREGGTDCIVSLTHVENPSQFGVVVLDEKGCVSCLIEKPKDPPSDLALVGIYIFNSSIHTMVDSLKPSGRGEYEITDAIQALVENGYKVNAHIVTGWWKDTGKPEDLLDANRLVLSQIKRSIQGTVIDSEIIGEVIIETGAEVRNSRIEGPVHIAADTLVDSSSIRPSTSIGKNARVIGSEIAYSIIFDNAVITNLQHCLSSSIIGHGAEVSGRETRGRDGSMRLVLGDMSQVVL